jgi:hypothetical protein
MHMQRLITGLILAVVWASLHAQTMDMRATIPFAFRAGETMMPAGDYIFRHWDSSLVIHKESGGPSVVLLTNAALRQHPSPDSRLNFNRYGERYFLSSVWSQGTTAGSEVMKSRAEKELARQTLRESVGIALRRQ